jgi:hypothetical protein
MTKLPQKYECFLKEYELLCKKHDLMVFSEGEPVWVGKADEDLWDVEKETEYRLEHCTRNHHR